MPTPALLLAEMTRSVGPIAVVGVPRTVRLVLLVLTFRP